jgi:glycosyltransferase involved in cell wall biosynthesis
MKGISFIIPCFNEEKHIERCIIAIAEEIHATKIQAEIIVIDNNCTDKTAEIAKKLGAIVIEESKKGVVWARQKGYSIAKYDLIANIDADSFLSPGWIRTSLSEIDDPRVAALTGPINFYDAPYWARLGTKLYYLGAYISNKYIGATIQGGNCLIKKEYLDICGGYDTSIEFYGEDTMTAKRLRKLGRIKFVFDMEIDSSARRLNQQGVFNTTWHYLINYFSVVLKGVPVTKEYKDYR